MFVWTVCEVKNFEHNFEQNVGQYDIVGWEGRRKVDPDGRIGLKGHQKVNTRMVRSI